MESWSSNIEQYELSDKYSIVKAKPEEFTIYESIYGDKMYNRFAVKSWDLRVAVTLDNPFAKEESYYWIKNGKIKIGGALLEPNVLSRLFIIPPFMDTYEIMKLLKKLLLKWSDSKKNIYAYQISPDQSNYFEMVGFLPDKNRRWMMRPTETFDFTWDNDVTAKIPQKGDCAEIAKLFYESFNGNIDWMYDSKQSGQVPKYEDYLEEVNEYFREGLEEDIMLEASTLVYDKLEKKLIGACLVSYVEGWPLIHTIGVNPSFRGKHLATTMLKRALTVLKSKYTVLRLFITIGNPAESVYYELGFVQGAEFKRFYIPAVVI
jgi:ribosomal protein S18 acetylase RimI-like enzyme